MERFIKRSPIDRNHLVSAYNREKDGSYAYSHTEIVETAGWTWTTSVYDCPNDGSACFKGESELRITRGHPNDIPIGSP